jgi:hypothetical protein
MNQTIDIKISAKWGSEFQRSISYQTIILILKAWVAFRRSTHAKNSIALVIDGKDLDDVQPDRV